jgi:hypothetical protein
VRLARSWAFVSAGLAAGFSGLAIVGYILGIGPLWVLEIALLVVAIALLLGTSRRASRSVSSAVWAVGRAGLVGGLAATVVYDASRTILSVLDPSPYNPFEAVRRFGIGILGLDAAPATLIVVGLAVHLLNGASFGGIYALFVGRRATTTRAALTWGLIWGITLEIIQSILYPGWLQISATLREFLVISGLGHVAYGLTLGAVCHAMLGRSGVGAGPAEATREPRDPSASPR